MRQLVIAAVLLAAACNGKSPTAPTPPPIVHVPITPPVIIAPPVVPTPPAFPPNDARFNMTFYRQFVHDAFELQGGLAPLRRQTQPPRIYLRTIHSSGRPIDELTLNQTAAALESTAGLLTGVFGLAGIERGTGTRAGEPGWITVAWVDDPERRYCGRAAFGGDWIDLYTNTPGCRCPGGPAIRLKTVKHELGHALGFRHTPDGTDLMFAGSNACDMNPSEREKYHAAIAYQRPVGSLPFP